MKFYCTFGSGQKYERRVIPILADSLGQARTYMFDTYGKGWSFIYTEEQWKENKEKLNMIGFHTLIEIEMETVDIRTKNKRKGKI